MSQPGPDCLIQWAKSRQRRSRCALSRMLAYLYRLRAARPVIRRILDKVEGGKLFSRTLREILNRQYGVTVGMYSYGECLKPGVLPRGTRIGNYCSIAAGLRIHRRNHPTDHVSQHPFFYNRQCGLIAEDSIEEDASNPLEIGHDVWIGTGAIILPKCRRIGNGAVVGAGSVVTRDVEPFTIVAGNPAHFIRHRFPPEVIERINASEWWNIELPELVQHFPVFVNPASLESIERLTELGPSRHSRTAGY